MEDSNSFFVYKEVEHTQGSPSEPKSSPRVDNQIKKLLGDSQGEPELYENSPSLGDGVQKPAQEFKVKTERRRRKSIIDGVPSHKQTIDPDEYPLPGIGDNNP